VSTPLSEVFNEPAPVVESTGAVEVEEVKPEVESTEDKTTAETTETETTTDAPPVSEDIETLKKQVSAFQAKADDEKQKRQNYERQLKQIAETQTETPDAFSAPDEAIAHAIAGVEQKFQNQLLNLSEQGARDRHDDFDTMKDEFFEKMVADNPALQAEALSQVDPYEFIYRTAKNHLELSQVNEAGGLDSMRKQIRKELKAEMQAEIEATKKAEVEKAIDGIIPNSLSTQRAAGATGGKTYAGPTPLSKIVGK